MTDAVAPACITPGGLGFYNPTDAQISSAISKIIAREYNGQCVVLTRTADGNVGRVLKDVCATEKVIIPGPVRFASVLRETIGEHWAAFVTNVFVTELYAQDIVELPSQTNKRKA